jgi:hypothetical protein
MPLKKREKIRKPRRDQNPADIGFGIAAFSLVQNLGAMLRSRHRLTKEDLEMLVQKALADLEELKPATDAAVRVARQLVEETLQGLLRPPQS